MDLVELYGGALTTKLPKSHIDVSTMREVPNNQEVFIIEGSNQSEDESIIIDLLEQVDKPIEEAIVDFIDDLKEPTDTVVQGPTLISELTNDLIKCKTFQYFIKFSSGLIIVIAVVRASRVKSDILISLNTKLENKGEVNILDIHISGLIEKVKQIGLNLDIKDYGLFVN